MEFMDKKLEDIVVTLPFVDGTSMNCGVFSYFEVNGKKYFALLPLKGEKELDFSQSYMLYEVEEDEEHNPIVLYIENDYEYAVVGDLFHGDRTDLQIQEKLLWSGGGVAFGRVLRHGGHGSCQFGGDSLLHGHIRLGRGAHDPEAPVALQSHQGDTERRRGPAFV